MIKNKDWEKWPYLHGSIPTSNTAPVTLSLTNVIHRYTNSHAC